MSEAAPGSRSPAEAFSVPGWSGEVAAHLRPPDLGAAVLRVVDPGAARETLHWGRNYLYATDLQGPDGRLPVVVKQFRNEGWRARLDRRWRGSKARRSWHVARHLEARGVDTPEPVMLVESADPKGPTHYVCRQVTGRVEARYLFRALAAGRMESLFPGVDEGRFLAALGGFLRRLHDAGVWHRDVSIGNLLIEIGEDETGVQILDLNRARIRDRLGVVRRTRDLTRLPILAARHRRAFLGAYWRGREAGLACKGRLFAAGVRLFLWRNRAKELVRRPFGWLGGLFRPRRAHPHIPPAPRDATAREKVVWDHLSDQPHQHAGRLEKLSVRLADGGAHLETAIAMARSAPRIWRRYRQLRSGLWAEPFAFDGVGVALRPWPRREEELLAAIEDLGLRHLLLRLHPWESDHRLEEELAAELHARGYELAFALPQNRELVRDLDRWRASIEELAERFVPYGRHFQVGQAINRSKWGVWNYREYLDLVAVASEALRGAGPVEILGPAVIDFELHAAAAVLNMPRPGVRFDAVSSLLYVDRRGAPENRQLGFDTVGKVTLLKAIADTSRSAGGRCWITEFNWPLWEGPHSPAGRSVAVDEESQADFLVRFYLQALGTGYLERAYWWQIVARGYGLVSPGGDGHPRRRPAFWALAQLGRRLSGATFHGPLEAPEGVCLYRFTDAEGAELVVAWSTAEPRRVALPGVTRAESRDGEALAAPPGGEVEVDRSPRYLWLGSG